MNDDMRMYEKGYRYKMTPVNGSFEPLYVKTVASVAPSHA
jgi:hypothetical protein